MPASQGLDEIFEPGMNGRHDLDVMAARRTSLRPLMTILPYRGGACQPCKFARDGAASRAMAIFWPLAKQVSTHQGCPETGPAYGGDLLVRSIWNLEYHNYIKKLI